MTARRVLVTIGAAVLAFALQPTGIARADNTLVARRIPYGTPIVGGIGNPCPGQANPGVTREGEGLISTSNGFVEEWTVTARTRYDAAVATATKAWKVAYGTTIPCADANTIKAHAPARALWWVACRGDARQRPAKFCAVSTYTDPAIIDANYKPQHNLLNMDYGCRAGGTGKFAGWHDLAAEIYRYTNSSGTNRGHLHNINIAAGQDGRLRDGGDPAEYPYGKVLTAPLAEIATAWMVTTTTELNRVRATGFSTTKMQGLVDGVSYAITNNVTLFGTPAGQSFQSLRSALCNNAGAPWIRNVVDYNYSASRIGLDQTVRDLFDLLGGYSVGYNWLCRYSPTFCTQKMSNLLFGFWDSGVDGTHPTNSCLSNRSKKQVWAVFAKQACMP